MNRDQLTEYARTKSFNQQTLPRGLKKAHDTKPGVWGEVFVESGELLLEFPGSQRAAERISAGSSAWVEPEETHLVTLQADTVFHVRFNRSIT